MRRLTVRCGDEVRHFAVPTAPARLGAARENEIVVPFRGVSRRHAELRPAVGGLLVRDLGSRNGVRLGRRRVNEARLEPGVSVLLGEAILELEDVSSSEAETALQLDALDGDSAPRSGSETAPLADGPSSPAAALRYVRGLEGSSGRSRDEELAGARRVLGAATLLLVRDDRHGEPAIVSCHGELPPDATWLPIACAAAAEAGLLVRPCGPGSALATRGRNDQVLLAFLVTTLRPAAWQRDFFVYLAERLLGADGHALEAAAEPAGKLVFPEGMVVGSSAAIQGLLRHIEATVRSDLNVLLVGETGTGKELFARMIHLSGPHAHGPFIAINCAAIPAELLEAELFGVAARVATGVDPRPGLFLQANGGTIFLDEIGDMSERLQAKILRVLQEHEVLPVGGTAAKKIDVRVISASNRDLGRLVKEGAFRADLFYRLRGLQFHIPPLRERREDVPELVAFFARRAAEKYRRRNAGVSRAALNLLMQHGWPGNVRELESETERAVLLCANGGVLQKEQFGTLAWGSERAGRAAPQDDEIRAGESADVASSLRDRLDALERSQIVDALARTENNQTRAARLLGITRNGLALKLKRLGLR